MTLNSLEYIIDININTENILVFVNNARMMTWQHKSVSHVIEARVIFIHIFHVQCLFADSIKYLCVLCGSCCVSCFVFVFCSWHHKTWLSIYGLHHIFHFQLIMLSERSLLILQILWPIWSFETSFSLSMKSFLARSTIHYV